MRRWRARERGSTKTVSIIQHAWHTGIEGPNVRRHSEERAEEAATGTCVSERRRKKGRGRKQYSRAGKQRDAVRVTVFPFSPVAYLCTFCGLQLLLIVMTGRLCIKKLSAKPPAFGGPPHFPAGATQPLNCGGVKAAQFAKSYALSGAAFLLAFL